MPRLTAKASKKRKRKRAREEMHKFKHGTLRSSNGKKVTNRKQAIAIALSESGQSRKKKRKGRRKAARKHKRKVHRR